MERLSSNQVVNSFLLTETKTSNSQTLFWDFVVNCSRAGQCFVPVPPASFSTLTENLIGKLFELAFHPFHNELVVFEEGHHKLTLTKSGDRIECISNVANLPIMGTISVSVLREAAETIFLKDNGALADYQNKLKSERGISSKILLYLMDAILNNPKQFASKAVEQAHQYFVAKTFPILNFDEYLVDDGLRNFFRSGTLPRNDMERGTLLSQFYQMMFIDNELGISADFSHDDAARCCAYIIRDLKDIYFWNLKHDVLKHGLSYFLGRFFNGEHLKFSYYINLHKAKIAGFEQDPSLISDILALSLSHNPNLVRIGISQHFNLRPKLNDALLKAFADNFRHSSTVTNVSIDGSCYELNQLKLLFSALKSHPILRELRLTYSWVRDEGFKELVTCLKAIPTLRNLVLDCPRQDEQSNQLHDVFGTLAEYLKCCPPLTRLELNKFNICKSDIDALVSGVVNNNKLIELFIRPRNFLHGQLAQLSFVLEKNVVLQVFRVSCLTHRISADDINGLANNLNRNVTLKQLGLYFDGVEPDVDLTNLIDAIVNHPCLKTLAIEFPMRLSDAIRLITQSRSLICLAISLALDTDDHDLTALERRLFLDTVKSNKSLISLYCVQGLTEQEQEEVQDHMASNRTAQLNSHRWMTREYGESILQIAFPKDIVGEIQNKMDDLYREHVQKKSDDSFW